MKVFLILLFVVTLASCVRNKNGQVIQNTTTTVTNGKVFEVTEVIQTSRYTYLKVKENLSDRWVAVSKQEIVAGDVFYYDKALQMNNFESKELNRTFEVIYFVNRISTTPISQNNMGGMPAHSGKIDSKSAEVSMNKMKGEISIAQVFSRRSEYESKEFEIRGIVVKVNKQVMGRNWIHIQDGTSDSGNFDLTITSQNLVKKGEVVTFKGKLTLNKNFGSGYFYDVIMENAELVTKAAS